MKNLENAKKQLLSGEYTCVLCRDDVQHSSTERGVKPLLAFYESGQDFRGYAAADKVVGKATAFLYVLLKVKAVYAGVISRSALSVLEKANIVTEYKTLAENIVNRKGDGICPFENAVLTMESPEDALMMIRKKIEELNR